MRSYFKFYFTCSSIFICFFLMLFFLCFPSNAASSQTYFPMVQNNNGLIPDAVYNYVLNNYGNYFFIRYAGSDGTFNLYYYVSFSGSYNKPVATLSPNGYQFSLVDNGHVTNNGRIRVVIGTGQLSRDSNNGGFANAFTNLNSSIYSPSTDYRSNFDLYTANNEGVLLSVLPINPPSDPSLSAPDFTGLDLDSSLNTTTIPTAPTYSNTFNENIPNYDSTAPFDSIFNIVSWGFRRAYSLLNSFLDYLRSWLGYFINILTYLIQKIIDVIKYIITWLFNSLVATYSPIFNLLKYIFGFLFNTDEQLSIWDVLFSLANFVISWLGNYWSNSWLLNFFTNLTNTYSTIQGYFEDLQIYFSKVALFFTTLVALGSDNGEFSITTLTTALFFPSSNQVLQIVEVQDTYGFLGAFSHLAEVFGGFVADLEDLEGAFIITLPSFTILGVQVEQQDIDFSWYLDLKPIGDGIISAFLIFGYLYWLFFRLSGILRGISAPASTPSELSDEYPKGSIIQRY